MWEPRRLATLWAFTACYRDSLTFFTIIFFSVLMFYQLLHEAHYGCFLCINSIKIITFNSAVGRAIISNRLAKLQRDFRRYWAQTVTGIPAKMIEVLRDFRGFRQIIEVNSFEVQCMYVLHWTLTQMCKLHHPGCWTHEKLYICCIRRNPS
jgi:hypothetical protein